MVDVEANTPCIDRGLGWGKRANAGGEDAVVVDRGAWGACLRLQAPCTRGARWWACWQRRDAVGQVPVHGLRSDQTMGLAFCFKRHYASAGQGVLVVDKVVDQTTHPVGCKGKRCYFWDLALTAMIGRSLQPIIIPWPAPSGSLGSSDPCPDHHHPPRCHFHTGVPCADCSQNSDGTSAPACSTRLCMLIDDLFSQVDFVVSLFAWCPRG